MKYFLILNINNQVLDTVPVSDTEIISFKTNCHLFYITSVEEIIKHLPMNDNIFKEILFTNYNVILDKNHCH